MKRSKSKSQSKQQSKSQPQSQAQSSSQAQPNPGGSIQFESSARLVHRVTEEIIKEVKTGRIPPLPEEIERKTIDLMVSLFLLENNNRGKDNRLPVPKSLLPIQIAHFLNLTHSIVCIACAGIDGDSEFDAVAVYMDDPADPNYGTYVTSETYFYRLVRKYNSCLSTSGCKEVIKILRTIAPRVPRCIDPDLIAVNNGIFNYKTKMLMDFAPKYVFMAKSHVNYNPDAPNVTIHNSDDGTDWDLESWLEELSDDTEIVDLIWEILGAVIRPNVPWNKAIFFLAESGNNGKGTLCVLMQGLCGKGSVAEVKIADFSKQFGLAQLLHATAIIADENPVGNYVDDAANFKAVVTGDEISIDRKFKDIIKFKFRGLVVECMNGMPRFRDKTGSIYRRQLIVPFDKCFTGKERSYIKEDYLKRPEVLEYVMYRVLNMTYYELSNPQRCREMLADFKEYNDPVRAFMEEFAEEFVWDLLPFRFLYDLYKVWFKKVNPSGIVQRESEFITDLLNVVKDSEIWECEDRSIQTRSNGRITCSEPLIIQYKLEDWMSATYQGSDPNQLAMPALSASYRGLVRRPGARRPADNLNICSN